MAIVESMVEGRCCIERRGTAGGINKTDLCLRMNPNCSCDLFSKSQNISFCGTSKLATTGKSRQELSRLKIQEAKQMLRNLPKTSEGDLEEFSL
jgi:hypothetical protein